MALTITTTLVGKTFYSHELNDIYITTDRSYVRVVLKTGEQEVFSSTYYAVNGGVHVRNLSSFFEAVLNQKGSAILIFTLIANDGNQESTVPFTVLYCRDKIIDLPASDFLEGYFLTSNLNRLTTIHSREELSLYLSYSNTYNNLTLKIAMQLRLTDGSIVSHTYNSFRRVGSGIVSVGITVADVLYNARTAYPGCSLLYFMLTCENRVCRFYVMPCPSVEQFSFRNNFGCMETVSFPAVTTTKLESDFSEAKVDGLLSHYDVRHSRTYEIETSSLISSHMTWLEQFVTSPRIIMYLGQESNHVLIKNYSFEQTNAPGAENKLSFTWQFADGRQTPHRISLSTGIFTEPFNDTFA